MRPAIACAITGAALYVTRGVLDQTVTASGVVRFALLPPWQALLGFVCLAALLLVGIDHLNAPRGTTAGRRPRLGELVLPLLALVVLLLPFVPVLPDRWPVVQALAGPLGAVVWLSVAALQLWTLWQARVITPRWFERWSVRRVTGAIWLATAVISAAAAGRLAGTTMFPGGDEPHYLVIAQSLWRDGDLKIENNHQRGDYGEYFPHALPPHYLTRGTDAEIYSVHPVGLPVVMAPVYAAAGYAGVVLVLVLLAATAAAGAWRWTMQALNAPGAATFAWAAVAGTAPFLLNTFTVYPEIAGALAAMIVMVTVTGRPASPALTITGATVVGVACATLPWLSTKYAPMSGALVLVALGRLVAEGPGPLAGRVRRHLSSPRAWAIVAPYAISVAGWLYFFYAIWGIALPMAPYGSMVQTTPLNLLFGAPGLLFDQEYGLLAFAPVYIMAATGLFQMWKAGGHLRRTAIEIVVVFAALLATVGAFRIWWGGSSSPARPIASGLLLLALPIAMAFRTAPAGSARRAAQHLLLWLSVGIAVTLTLARDGFLIVNGRDGTSALLEYWLPRWDFWSLAPTFVFHETSVTWLRATSIGWLHALWWLAVAAAAGVFLARQRTTRPGLAALIAAGTLTAALAVLAVTMRWLPAGAPLPPVDLGARSRLASLDGFDARVRPTAVIYDPLRKVDAAAVLPQMLLGVTPLQRPDPQPIRVIHNGRFSLPAGTYDIEVTFGDQVPTQPTTLSLQVGRIGPPLRSWALQPAPGEHWKTSLWLALDAGFVGFRGPVEIERAIAAVTITPTAVVDAGARPRLGEVLATATYADVMFYFHNEQLYPEPNGFWTIGKRSAEVTVAVPAARATPVVLRIHGGAQATNASFDAFGWRRSYALVPGQAAEVELPITAGGVVPLTISTDNGFSPGQVDAASKDQRFLGIWVEVVDKPRPPQ